MLNTFNLFRLYIICIEINFNFITGVIKKFLPYLKK